MAGNLSQLNNLIKDDLYLNQPKKRYWQGLAIGVLVVLITMLGLVALKKKHSILVYPGRPESTIQLNQETSSNLSGSSNILILGIPGQGQGNDAPNLTDTILLANLQNNAVNLISIPRDFLVKIPDGQNYTKINALYALGGDISLIQKKIEEISGLTINYYIIVDLQIIKELIDKIGGLNVLVQKDIYDTYYPGPNHSFQIFEIEQGWRYLNGETALKYIRSRYSTSDFDRMERQQKIIDALKKKFSSLKIWNLKEIADIYSSLSSHIKTDLSPWEIWQIWKAINPPAKNSNELTNGQISKYAIDEKFLISDTISLGGQETYILKPKAGLENYSEIKKYIQENY